MQRIYLPQVQKINSSTLHVDSEGYHLNIYIPSCGSLVIEDVGATHLQLFVEYWEEPFIISDVVTEYGKKLGYSEDSDTINTEYRALCRQMIHLARKYGIIKFY